MTRGDVEEIRGWRVNTQIVKTLEEQGWIEVVGHKEVPVGLVSTPPPSSFFPIWGLRALAELPPLPELLPRTWWPASRVSLQMRMVQALAGEMPHRMSGGNG